MLSYFLVLTTGHTIRKRIMENSNYFCKSTKMSLNFNFSFILDIADSPFAKPKWQISPVINNFKTYIFTKLSIND